jgi:signal transduction histidine kinase
MDRHRHDSEVERRELRWMSQVSRRRGRRYWGRILLANFAGALAVVGVSGGFAPGVRLASLARGLAVSMVYANLIGTLLAVTMPRVAGRCWAAPTRYRWSILLAAMAVVTIAGTFAANVLLYGVGYIPRGRFVEWMWGSISTALVISLIIGVSVTAYETLRGQLDDAMVALRTKERDEADARRVAAEAQLASIESRVQPHFLFNTLNSIAALVHDDPAGAERMTGQLAALLRSALDSTATPLVPLDDELRVVRAYLDIEGVRFGDRLRYSVDVPDGDGPRLVPRMALQTLVENSVKFAVSPRREGASIAVRVRRTNGRLALSVDDDGPGFDPGERPAGHGLDLLAARLKMLFGDRASLRVESRPGHSGVTIEVPETVPQTVPGTVPETDSGTEQGPHL